MFPIETTFVAHDNNEVLTVKLRHETSLVAYSTDKRSITFHRNDKNVFYDSFYSFFFRGLSFPDLGGLSFLGLSFPDLGGLSFLGLRSEVCVF